MKVQSIIGVVLTAALVGGLIGCNARPILVEGVDQSVLPASAKALLAQDAVITHVDKETYSGGNENYVLHYTLNGMEKSIKISAKDHTSASGVFERLN